MTNCFRALSQSTLILLCLASAPGFAVDSAPHFEREIAPLLKRHCVKCHGPAKQEGKLNVAVTSGLLRGGKSGPAIVPHDADASLMWQRVSSDEMPPDAPLTSEEKGLLKRWIIAGSPGIAKEALPATDANHWAFRRFSQTDWQAIVAKHVDLPPTNGAVPSHSTIDSFIRADLHRDGLSLSPTADRATLIRRVSYDLTGLPPTPEAIAEYLNDPADDAHERMVDRYLASPRFGERIGKFWLDAAGYADSNGYFNADTDRPLAFRYRDYVIRAFNSDKPFDQFVREQIAGDELAASSGRFAEAIRNGDTVSWRPDSLSSASRLIEMLEATHYLRNGQDGTGESDGNPDEVRVDRYTVIETTMQNVSTGLLGLTIQCAKCHDHKFEPLTQRDYYSFQAVLIPAFPPEQWVKPNDRFVYASLPGEQERWQRDLANAEAEVARRQSEIGEWVIQNRPKGKVIFSDSFDGAPESLASSWSNTAPGDDAPAGTAAINLNSREAPGAIIVDGRLHLVEGGPGGDKWLSTKTSIDWTPDVVGASIQATFDLVENRVGDSKPAERIGYLLATHDFNDNGSTAGGNILIDGHPSSSTAVFLDYPGSDSKQAGVLGTTGYVPKRNYGVRITNKENGQFLMEQLVDWQVEEKSLTLKEADLPPGGFGFEFCCGRSFVIDNVSIESFAPTDGKNPLTEFLNELKTRRQPLEAAAKRKSSLAGSRPGRIAWTTDLTDKPPQTHVLLRGNYNTPGEPVEPAVFQILASPASASSSSETKGLDVEQPQRKVPRLKFAETITHPDSAAASLLARVHVNRIWQHHFGTGIVSTPDNFGLSGSPPSHPELLDWLAAELVRSGWSTKQITRLIVNSATYKQSSLTDAARSKLDPDARRLSRFPIRRLDAEALRDAMLFASGDLDDRMFGPYIPTTRTGTGETVVTEDNPGSKRRSIYLQQKRTQVHSLLQVFDAPSIVFNSTRRSRSTMPLQSLNQLNSDFSVARGQSLARRLMQESISDSERLQQVFLLATGRPPADADLAAANQFLDAQASEYGRDANAKQRAWSDLSQMLLIGNAALYLE